MLIQAQLNPYNPLQINTYVVLRTFIFPEKCNTKNKTSYLITKTKERKNEMFLNQNSDCVLKAKLASAVATSQLEISVTYKDNTDVYHPDAVVATNNTTAVTLLSAPSSGVVNIVELIKIYNPDTQANTVQIMATDTVIYSYTIGAGQSAIISAEGVIGSGNAGANADLSNLTAAGKAVAANMAMPSSSYINLTLGASGSTYTAPADGYLLLNKQAHINAAAMAFSYDGTYEHAFATRLGTITNDAMTLFAPVYKGQVVYIIYNTTGATNLFRFIYAQGEV